MSIYERMMNIDRRIIYAILAILVIIIVLKPLGLPVKVGSDTQHFHDYMESLPEGSVVWLDTAYGPGTIGELNPMVIATLRHAFSLGHKVIIAAMWEQGPQLAQDMLEMVMAEYPDVEYGEDVVHLGFRPGGAAAVLQQHQKSIEETVAGVDHLGNKISELPLMQEVPKLTNEYVDFIVVYETGSPGTIDYLTYVTQEQGIPLSTGIIAMSVPGTKPYLDSGQYEAIIPGSRGAAEYEMLIGHPAKAVKSQDAISAAALYAVLLIIIGNIGYLFLQNK